MEAKIDLPRAADLPGWMATLRDRYLQTETGQFVLYGNVHDVVQCAGRDWSLPDFLDACFTPSGKLLVHYDPGRGIWFPKDADAAKAAVTLAAAGLIDASKVSPRGNPTKKMVAQLLREELAAERTPEVVLHMIEVLLNKPDTPTAVILHYAEMIAPDGAVSSLGFLDRTAGARLHRWSLSREIVGRDNIVVMLCAALPELARRITRNPRVGAIQVPLPDPLQRARFLARVNPSLDPQRGEKLTRVTAGLQLRQIQDLVSPRTSMPQKASLATSASEVFTGASELPVEAIAQRKKEILEQECYGLIEMVDPDHDFSHVGGNAPIKNALMRVAGHVQAGRKKQVPMGILFVGPMGTGKSFVAEAFARESGMAAVKLKNFRDRWVGSTEANLEKVLSVIEGLGEILVIIDEGDRSLGAGAGGDGGVSSRVMARLKEFMSDPTHRGSIIFVMMTNRPDKLDTDMKRPGRFDMKIPFFPPQDAQERALITRAIASRHGVDADWPDEALLPLLEPLQGYAAADLEALVLLAYDDFHAGIMPEGVGETPEKVTVAYLEQAVRDFMPTRETAMIEYMELLAVHEASNRRLLPARWHDVQVDDLNARLARALEALHHRHR